MPPELKLPLPLVLAINVAVFANLIFWPWLAIRWSNGRPPVAYEPRRPVPWSWIDPLVVMLVMFLLSGAVYAALAAYYGGHIPEPTGPSDLATRLAIGMAVELTTLLFAWGWLRLTTPENFADLGVSLLRPGYDLTVGGFAYLATIVPIMGLQALLSLIQPYEHPLIEAYQKNPEPAMLLATLVMAVVVAPLCEEFFFRVMLQGWFELIDVTRRTAALAARQAAVDQANESPGPPIAQAATGLAEVTTEQNLAVVAKPADDNNPYRSPLATDSQLAAPTVPAAVQAGWWPVVVSSAIFALFHWGQGLAPISLFFLALVLGYLYRQTHRIWPSLIVHALVNGGSVLILWLATATKHA